MTTLGPSGETPAASFSPLFSRAGMAIWRARLATAVLLTGFLFFLWGAPYGSLSLLLLASVGLWLLGLNLERLIVAIRRLVGVGAPSGRDHGFLNQALALRAAALAGLYYTAYSAIYVPELAVVDNPVLAAMVLLAVAGLFLWILDRWDSESTAQGSLLLAWFAVLAAPTAPYRLTSFVLLAGVAAVLMVFRGWLKAGWVTLGVVHLGLLLWRALPDSLLSYLRVAVFFWVDGSPLRQLRIELDWYESSPTFWRSFSFLAACWVLFSMAALLAGKRGLQGRARVVFVTFNNVAFLVMASMTFPEVFPNSTWKLLLGYGLALLLLALAGRVVQSSDPTLWRTFFAHGVVLLALGLAELAVEPAALRLAIVSAALLVAAYHADSHLLRLGGDLLGLLSLLAGWEQATRGGTEGVMIGALVGSVLLFNAWWTARERLGQRPRGRVYFHAALGLLLLLALAMALPSNDQPPVLALGALLLTGLFYYLWKVPEVPILTHGYLFSALVLSLTQGRSPLPLKVVDIDAGPRVDLMLQARPINAVASVIPVGDPKMIAGAAVVLASLILIHWWRARGPELLGRFSFRLLEVAYSAGVVGTLAVTLRALLPDRPDFWIAAVSVLGVASLAYALVTRALWVGVFGQVFLILAAVETFGQLWRFAIAVDPAQVAFSRPSPWGVLLVVVAMAAVPGLLNTRLGQGLRPAWRDAATPRRLSVVYGVIAAVLLTAGLRTFVAAHLQLLVLELVGFLVMLWSVFVAPQRVRKGGLLASLFIATAAVSVAWLVGNGLSGFRWLDLAAFTLLLVQQQVAKRQLPPGSPPQALHDLAIMIGISSLWWWVSLWSAFHFADWTTAAWAVLAVVVFAIGLVAHERMYSTMGWAIAGGGVLRALLLHSDVQPINSAISFAAVGAVLFVFALFQAGLLSQRRLGSS